MRRAGIVTLSVGVIVVGLVGWSVSLAVGDEDQQRIVGSSSTVVTTVVSPTSPTSTTSPSLVNGFSRAWSEIETLRNLVSDLDILAYGDISPVYEYVASNPNEWSTPMGALCWGDFELSRTVSMVAYRNYLDEIISPEVIRLFGLSQEEVPVEDNGPARTAAVISALDARVPNGNAVSTTSATSASTSTAETITTTVPTATDDYVDDLRYFHRISGSGTEWLNAVETVASEEWRAAVFVGDTLPPAVLRYADALAGLARRELGRTDPLIMVVELGPVTGGDDYWAFVDAAKRDPNCLRAELNNRPAEELILPTTPSTTIRTGTVTLGGANLDGVLVARESGISTGYSRLENVGTLSDTTFRYNNTNYEVERLLWWPNGTIRLDTYPDGLDAMLADDAWLVIAETGGSGEHAWRVGDARHLGGGAEFVWDTTFVPETESTYSVELRVGVPGIPQNVTLSGTTITWTAAAEGPAAEKYFLWVRPKTPGPTTNWFYKVATNGAATSFPMGGMPAFLGTEYTVLVRAYNSAGYSPWSELATFTTPTSSS